MAVFSVLTTDGDLSIAFLLGLWVLGGAACAAAIHQRGHKPDGTLDAERVMRWSILALTWPFIGMLAAVLLPIMVIGLGLALMTKAAPAVIYVLAPIIELAAKIGPSIQSRIEESLDNLNLRIFAIHEGRPKPDH